MRVKSYPKGIKSYPKGIKKRCNPFVYRGFSSLKTI